MSRHFPQFRPFLLFRLAFSANYFPRFVFHPAAFSCTYLGLDLSYPSCLGYHLEMASLDTVLVYLMLVCCLLHSAEQPFLQFTAVQIAFPIPRPHHWLLQSCPVGFGFDCLAPVPSWVSFEVSSLHASSSAAWSDLVRYRPFVDYQKSIFFKEC